MKCGIIGCGIIAPTHAAGYRQLPHVELTACCDLIPERAEKLAREYSIAHVYTDYRKLLADPEVTAVSICTDHASHAKIFCDAIAAGKHVICEKVPGRTPEDLKQMVRAAAARPDLVAAGIFQHRFVPGNIALRELIRQGKFGKLLLANLNFSCKRTEQYYRNDPWRGTIAGEGGGVLINQAIHFIDQLRFLFGEIRQVAAKCANRTHQGVIETEDTVALVAEFESGLFVTANATNSAFINWRSTLSISGTEAQAEFVDEKLSFLDGSDPAEVAAMREALSGNEKGDDIVGKSYYGVGHTDQLADFLRAIEEHRAPRVTIAEAANSAALVHAVYAAAASGNWEPVARY